MINRSLQKVGIIPSVKKYFQFPLYNAPFSWSFCRACMPFVIVLGILLGLSGCGLVGSKATASSETPAISVAITQAPPTSIIVGNAVPMSATVSGDPANAGIDWVATCGSAPLCGSFSPAHTASGATTIYTAPTEVPAQGTVAVTALSTTNRGEQVAAYVTVLPGVTGITITQAPPASVPAGVTINLAATVIGDPANLGVDWKATCGTSGVLRTPVDCTPPSFHSAAGGNVQFVVPTPLQIPNIVGSTVTITAYPTADHSFSATALLTVTTGPTITFTQNPPSSMLTNATATVAAVVNNDTTNAGITWSASCDIAPCGSIFPLHTASGVAATYTAPSSVADPNQFIVITATSTAVGPWVSVTANVTIVAPVSVKITQGVPTGAMAQGTTAPLIATVSNDPGSAGVDWTVTCGSSGACGSFSPTHTVSGTATTFTAPGAVPAGNSVTITATSSTDHSQSDQQTVTITAGAAPDSLLLGNFVILLTAKNSINGPYALGGVISGDGIGNITKGGVDLVDASGNASPAASVSVVSPSTYSIGADGRGSINLTLYTGTLNGSFGVNGTGAITLSVLFVTPHHAVLSEMDSFGNGTGTLDGQNPNDLAALESGSLQGGNYTLELSGVEASSPNPSYAMASAVNLNFSTKSYSYVTDQSDKGVITSNVSSSGSLSFSFTKDQNGQLTFNPINLGLPTKFNLDTWLIDANHFVVTDWRDSFSGSPNIIVGGYLTAQPSAPSISGTYAFTVEGATATAQPQVAGGILTCGSTGTLDVTPLGGTALSNQSISANCTAPANGRGLFAISGSSTAGFSQFAAYPTIDQGLYLIDLDGGSAGTSGPSGTGAALQQTLTNPIPNTAFSGNYASNFQASAATGSQNLSGLMSSDGASTTTGVADVNSFSTTSAPPAGTPSSSATLNGSFTGNPDGRFPLTLSILPATGQPAPEFTTVHSACYVVDASTCLLLGLDTTAPGTGMARIQNTGL